MKTLKESEQQNTHKKYVLFINTASKKPKDYDELTT